MLEILGHLADVEIIYRLRQMLADTKPVIAPLDRDAKSALDAVMRSRHLTSADLAKHQNFVKSAAP